MEAWLAVGDDGTLGLKTGESLLRLYAAAAGEDAATAALLAAGSASLPASLAGLVDGAGVDLPVAWMLLVAKIGQPDLAKLAPLMRRLDSFAAPATIVWPILAEDVVHKAQANDIGFGLKGGLAATLELEACATSGGAPPIGADQRLVRIGALGSVQASAKLTVPLNIGSIGAQAAGEANAKLAYYTHHSKKTVLAEAVIGALAHLHAPFTLSSAAAFFDAFPQGAIQLDANANLKFAVNVALASPFAVGVPGSSEIAVATTACTGGQCKALLVKPDIGKPYIRLSLDRGAMTAEELAATIKLDVDLSAMTARVKTLVAQGKELSAKAKHALAKLDPFFTPGTYLKGRIEALVRQRVEDDAFKGLALNALGFGAGGKPGDALTKRIENAINGLDKLWTAKQDELVKNLAANIEDALPAAGAASMLAQRLTPPLTILLQDLKRDLAGELRALALDNKAFEAFRQGLNDAGVIVQDTFGTLDEAADALTGPVQEMLDKFQSSVAGLLKKVDGYIGESLKAQAALLKSKTTSHTLDLDVSFNPSSAVAAGLYGRTFTDELASVFDEMRIAPADAVTLHKTAFTGYLQQVSGSTIKLTFGQFAFTARTVLTSGVKFTIDAAGTIDAESAQDITSETECLTRERVVFVSAQRLRANHAQATAISLSVARSGKSAKSERLDMFFGPVIDAQLLDKSVLHNAREQFAAWRSKADAQTIPLRLTLARDFADAEIMALLQLERDAAGVARAAKAFDLKAVQTAAANALLVSTFGNQAGDGIVDEFDAQKTVGRAVYVLFDRLRRANVPVPDDDIPSGLIWLANLAGKLDGQIDKYHVKLPSRAKEGIPHAVDAARMVRELGLGLQAMRDIVISKPVAGDKAQPGEMTIQMAADRGQQIVDGLSSWVKTDGPNIPWFDDADISAATVGFLRALHDLGGPGNLKAAIELVDGDTLKPRTPRMLAPLN